MPVSRRWRRKRGSVQSAALMSGVGALRYECGPRDTRKAATTTSAACLVPYKSIAGYVCVDSFAGTAHCRRIQPVHVATPAALALNSNGGVVRYACGKYLPAAVSRSSADTVVVLAFLALNEQRRALVIAQHRLGLTVRMSVRMSVGVTVTVTVSVWVRLKVRVM